MACVNQDGHHVNLEAASDILLLVLASVHRAAEITLPAQREDDIVQPILELVLDSVFPTMEAPHLETVVRSLKDAVNRSSDPRRQNLGESICAENVPSSKANASQNKLKTTLTALSKVNEALNLITEHKQQRDNNMTAEREEPTSSRTLALGEDYLASPPLPEEPSSSCERSMLSCRTQLSTKMDDRKQMRGSIDMAVTTSASPSPAEKFADDGKLMSTTEGCQNVLGDSQPVNVLPNMPDISLDSSEDFLASLPPAPASLESEIEESISKNSLLVALAADAPRSFSPGAAAEDECLATDQITPPSYNSLILSLSPGTVAEEEEQGDVKNSQEISSSLESEGVPLYPLTQAPVFTASPDMMEEEEEEMEQEPHVLLAAIKRKLSGAKDAKEKMVKEMEKLAAKRRRWAGQWSISQPVIGRARSAVEPIMCAAPTRLPLFDQPTYQVAAGWKNSQNKEDGGSAHVVPSLVTPNKEPAGARVDKIRQMEQTEHADAELHDDQPDESSASGEAMVPIQAASSHCEASMGNSHAKGLVWRSGDLILNTDSSSSIGPARDGDCHVGQLIDFRMSTVGGGAGDVMQVAARNLATDLDVVMMETQFMPQGPLDLSLGLERFAALAHEEDEEEEGSPVPGLLLPAPQSWMPYYLRTENLVMPGTDSAVSFGPDSLEKVGGGDIDEFGGQDHEDSLYREADIKSDGGVWMETGPALMERLARGMPATGAHISRGSVDRVVSSPVAADSDIEARPPSTWQQERERPEVEHRIGITAVKSFLNKPPRVGLSRLEGVSSLHLDSRSRAARYPGGKH